MGNERKERQLLYAPKKPANVCRGSIFVELLTSASVLTYQHFNQRDPTQMQVKTAQLWL
jgi:hypothetical protein